MYGSHIFVYSDLQLIDSEDDSAVDNGPILNISVYEELLIAIIFKFNLQPFSERRKV